MKGINFAKNSKALREKIGFSQTQLAGLIGVEKSYVCKWEKGERVPDRKTIIKSAEVLNDKKGILLGAAGYLPDDILAILKEKPREVMGVLRESFDIKPLKKNKFMPKKVVEMIAYNDLKEYWKLTGTGKEKLEFPLDLVDIFKVIFDLDTVFVNFDEVNLKAPSGVKVSAVLCPDGRYFNGRDKLILINNMSNKIPEEAKRFSIAHEGGHYSISFRHHREDLKTAEGEIPIFCNTKNGKYDENHPDEFHANCYAATLLIPRGALLKEIGNINKIDLSVWAKRLCERFGVSRQVIEYRLYSLGIKCEKTRFIYDSS